MFTCLLFFFFLLLLLSFLVVFVFDGGVEYFSVVNSMIMMRHWERNTAIPSRVSILCFLYAFAVDELLQFAGAGAFENNTAAGGLSVFMRKIIGAKIKTVEKKSN